jgi:hypothetical protein
VGDEEKPPLMEASLYEDGLNFIKKAKKKNIVKV